MTFSNEDAIIESQRARTAPKTRKGIDMKREIIVVAAFVVVCALGLGIIVGVVIGDRTNHAYAAAMVVVQVDAPTDTVTCEDANGNLWQFKGCDDWMLGDIAAMMLDDHGTEEIYDDEITGVWYSGSTIEAEG